MHGRNAPYRFTQIALWLADTNRMLLALHQRQLNSKTHRMERGAVNSARSRLHSMRKSVHAAATRAQDHQIVLVTQLVYLQVRLSGCQFEHD